MQKGTKIGLAVGCFVLLFIGGLIVLGVVGVAYFASQEDDSSNFNYNYNFNTNTDTFDLDSLDDDHGGIDGDVYTYFDESGAEFSFILPEGWHEETGLNDVADFQASNDSEYMIVISESKEDFTDTVDLQAYYDLVAEDLVVDYDNAELGTPANVELDFYDAVQVDFSASISETNIGYLMTMVETDDHYHQIWMWSTLSSYETNKPEFEKTAASILEYVN